MKKILIFISIMLMFAGNVWAEAIKPYVSIGTGISMPTEIENSDGESLDLNSTFKGSLALGVEAGVFRGEMEYAYRDFDMAEIKISGVNNTIMGSVESEALMWNGYWNPFHSDIFLPYIGVGVGMTWEEAEVIQIAEIDINDVKAEETGFAYQFMLGVTKKFTEHLSTDLEYRYFNGIEIATSEIGFNLRYSF